MGLFDAVAGALGGAAQGRGGQGGDALGAALGGLLGGGQGGGGQAALISAVLGLLAQGGGLSGLLEKFQRGGLGDVAGSWVGPGANLPVSAQQLESVLGGDLLGQLAGQLGLSPQAAGEQLAQLLPQAVDQLTPEGRLPDQDPLAGGLGDIGAILGRFGGR
ncbi:YidB family protein [Piscinibacter sakaiensis]|uniref:DUF937 domain-containing protein n=1 Tax=Piscinibacter sakaiensis TaxID=1547922 RepID=A0A0K8P4D4_PISS1|nr:YidB family protein [Piscinibacter sakaiensis]GAP37523.1 hypothetical protein ISF6_3378 [Piscinibacter sakaiensis]